MEGSNFTPMRPTETAGDHPGSLRHLLSADRDPRPHPPAVVTPQSHASTRRDADSPKPDSNRTPKQPAAMTTTTRRNKDGNISSVYSGNRIRFLKKDDGEPLWRKDIQYLFLRTVFQDQRRVFTKASDGTQGHTFAEIYIDAMAKSSKCSQILKDKLLTDTSGAVDMAMICLLVNVGRMNTTLNFFPEMRARVRTYHSIPSLQAQQGTQAYKQLQDGPRLKSILKGATEDSVQPGTIDEIMSQSKPRTNPVNLIFVLSQYAPKISEMHFFPPRDFFDIFIRTTLSSRSRATAFLWMIWWYLESDFSAEDALRNPFGRGIPGDDVGSPIKVPAFEILSEEDAALENVDTEEEIAFGHAKKLEREAILSNDMPPTASAPKRGNKTPLMEQQHNYRFRVSPYGSSASGSEAGSRGRPSPSPPRDSRHEGVLPGSGRFDRDATQSPPPIPSRPAISHVARDMTPAGSGQRINQLLNKDLHTTPSTGPSRNKGVGRGNYPRKPKEPSIQPFEQVHRQPELQPHPPSLYQAHNTSHDYPELQSASNISHLFNPPDPRMTPQHVGPSNGALQGYWVPLNGPSVDQQSSMAIASGQGHGTGSKRPRNPSAYQREVERSRRERINYLLHYNMRAMQKAHRRQRRRRGVLADAWIKCRALTAGWDSEEDEPLGRWGGVDDIRTVDGTEAMLGVGDVGERVGEVARAWRKVGRMVGAGALIDRDRKLLRGKSRSRRFLKQEDSFGIEDGASPSPPHEQVASGPSVEPVVVEELNVPRKKRPYKRKLRLSIMEDDIVSAAAARVSKGSRKRTNAKAFGEGVATESYAGDGRVGKRGGRRPKQVEALIATEEKGEIDEMDRELLADAADAADAEGFESVAGSEDEGGEADAEEESEMGHGAVAAEEELTTVDA